MINRALKLGLFLLFIAAVLGGKPLPAMDLYTYDLDSMAYMSTDIVEGDVVQWHSYKNIALLDFRVTDTLKGNFKKGDVFSLEAMDFYTTSRRGMGPSEKLKPGDHLMLFCSRAKSVFLYDIPQDAVIYWIVPGGVRLLQDGRAYSYRQFSNPGPYVAMTPDDGFKDMGTPLKTLRSQVAASMRVADRYTTLLASSKTTSDPKALLDLLKTRRADPEIAFFVPRDQIAEDIKRKIADLKNPEAADAALQFKGANYADFYVELAFNTPQGREYLLKHIADPHVPLENRIRLAWTLPEAISAFGERTGPDAHYMARIAQIAADCRDDSLTVPLIGAVQRLAGTIAQVRPQQARLAALLGQMRMQQKNPTQDADLDQAVATLTKLYTTTSSDRVKFAIEGACAATGMQEQYENLHSPCGPILSETEQPKTYDSESGHGKRLSMQFQISPVNHTDMSQLTCLLVFEGTDTHKELTEPAGINGLDKLTMGQMGGGQHFDLPQGIGHGQYHVFLEFLNADGAVVSRGWGSTLSL